MSTLSGTGFSSDLIIIGAGIHGCSAALFSALRGMSVTVIEKDSVARHASGVNAGGVRRLGRHLAELPISVRSMEIWYRIAELVDDDCGFQVSPQIKLALREEQLEQMRRRVAELQALGYDHETMLTPADLLAHIPGVTDRIVGAIGSLHDGFAQPYQTTFAIHRKARSLGVRFYEGLRAESVSRDGVGIWEVKTAQGIFRAPKVLVAAGLWAGAFAESLGEAVPMSDYAPMMMVTTRLRPFCHAVVGAAGVPLSFKQMPNGTVVIGGGRPGLPDPETNRAEATFAPLRLSARTVTSLFPIMAEASIVRAWAGLEGRMADEIPVVGASKRHPGLYYAFGFSAHGFQLGPGTGEIMAELMATGQSPVDLAPLRIDRFGELRQAA
ncbi:NAD(P)/FAD-dependent oxidoreductase [Bosea sp. PAMC 26642]|uniref:NAD(P)/FAD-dependent oxidoreductase n=1 Tax=Bosea sp. (strain PAMC 26642) TaxID=1792307 RepID=UPI00076FEB97|nr:FAD-binding oxidoreductase [Bosea sp. PAMC 26642]AMJ61583.1 FAD-dependent oxidoreductase [Bosea sp. PAMC 26642]